MQNSGLGNCINPLTSLTNIDSTNTNDSHDWLRGDPEQKDEPQHQLPGKNLIDQLNILGIDYKIMRNEEKNFEKNR